MAYLYMLKCIYMYVYMCVCIYIDMHVKTHICALIYSGMDTQTIRGRMCKKLVIVVAEEESQKGWKTVCWEKDSCLYCIPFGTF